MCWVSLLGTSSKLQSWTDHFIGLDLIPIVTSKLSEFLAQIECVVPKNILTEILRGSGGSDY